MSMQHKPKLVIGMPVYNGETHLAETIDSILNQSFSDFSLFISDNASTDNTQKICETYASRDNRIIYYRQPQNKGMAFNFNYVFRPEEAPYFKWAAHDDLLKPDYLLECVNLLDREPSLALAHCPTSRIDNDSNYIKLYKDLGLSGDRVSERFWRVLWTINIYEIYSVMRTNCVAKAQTVGDFFGAERNLLTDVLLQGNIAYLDESLFSRRDHQKSLTAMHREAKANKDFEKQQAAHSSKQAKMPEIQVSAIKFLTYFSSIFKFPMPFRERVACLRVLLDWGVKRIEESLFGEKYRQKLYKDINSTFSNS